MPKPLTLPRAAIQFTANGDGDEDRDRELGKQIKSKTARRFYVLHELTFKRYTSQCKAVVKCIETSQEIQLELIIEKCVEISGDLANIC